MWAPPPTNPAVGAGWAERPRARAAADGCGEKAPPQAPWITAALGRVVAERTDIPPGVVNVLTSDAVEVGEALVTNPGEASAPNWKQQLRRLPMDPWSNPYQYAYPGQRSEFDVFSFGADGQEGGEGINADIGNWNLD